MHAFRLLVSVWFISFGIAMAATPTMSPPKAVSSPARGTTGGQQHTPAVAVSATGFLFVWVDQENYYSQSSRLLGLRSERNGNPIDTTPFLISDLPVMHQYVAATSDGTNYYVAWADSRAGTNDYYPDLYGTFVSSNGVVANPNGVVIHSAPDAQTRPRAIGGAEGFFILWNDGSGPPGGRGARIASNGTLLDPGGVPMDLPLGGVLGSDGSNYIYVANQYVPERTNYSTFRWRIAAANASVSSAALIQHSDDPRNEFALAFNGSRFMLATKHWTSNSTVFLNPDGTFMAAGPAIPQDFVEWHKLVSRGGEFILLTVDYGQSPTVQRFSGVGFLLSSNTLPIRLTEYAQDSGFVGGNKLVIFGESYRDEEPIAAVLGGDGSFEKQFAVQGPNTQGAVAITSDGTDFLAAWTENRDGTNLVYVEKITALGTLQTNTLAVAGQGYGAALAYASGVYFVAWSDGGRRVLCRRLNRSGNWLDPAPITLYSNIINDSLSGVQVATSGTNLLVAWHQQESDFRKWNVVGQTISTNLVNASTPFEISVRRSLENTRPSIVFDGVNYIVGWSEYDYFRSIYYRLLTGWRSVSPSGVLSDEVGSTAEPSGGLTLARSGTITFAGWSGNGYRLAALNGTNMVPSGGIAVDFGGALAMHKDQLWVAGSIYTGQTNCVAFASFKSNLLADVPAFRIDRNSARPRLASNGTNLLAAYESPAGQFGTRETPRIIFQVISPDTRLHLVRGNPPRLNGVVKHPFVLEQSSNLTSWQPYYTNNVGLPQLDLLAPPGAPRFVRLQWYSAP